MLRGHLTTQFRDEDAELSEGELFVVPRGVEYCPEAEEEAHGLLIEPPGTVNAGDAGEPLTTQETHICAARRGTTAFSNERLEQPP